MTANIKPVKYDPVPKTHTPMIAGDTIDPTVIPKSTRSGNQLKILDDGLYLGTRLLRDVYYISSAGQNLPTFGTHDAPMQTLEYCLQQLVAQSLNADRIEGDITIALKAGETFPLTNSYRVAGKLRIAFYGDSNYGDFDGPLIGTGAYPSNMANLNRPIITNATITTIPRGTVGLRLQDNATLRLSGIQVNLPARPSPAPQLADYGNLCDFVTAVDFADAALITEGVIINMLDANAVHGFAGVHARGTLNLMQYASQLQVGGVTLTEATATPQSLLARKWFFKMYYDYPGANQTIGALDPSTANASSGSGFLKLNWSEVQAQTVVGSATNLSSFPFMFNVTYGMRNYINGLIRDQQSRPLNVIASALM